MVWRVKAIKALRYQHLKMNRNSASISSYPKTQYSLLENVKTMLSLNAVELNVKVMRAIRVNCLCILCGYEKRQVKMTFLFIWRFSVNVPKKKKMLRCKLYETNDWLLQWNASENHLMLQMTFLVHVFRRENSWAPSVFREVWAEYVECDEN